MAVTDLLRRDEADALVREAHLNLHRHPEGFAGVRARLRLSDERGVRVGRAELRAGSAPAVAMEAGDPSGAWLVRELGDMWAARRPLAYADGDGRAGKDMPAGQDGPLGTVVHLDDEALTTYWLENGHVARASRTVAGGRLTVVVQENVVAPDGAAVPTHFTRTLQDESSGAVVAVDTCRDRWVARWGVLLPAGRRVVSLTSAGSTMRDLVVDHHALLDAAAA